MHKGFEPRAYCNPCLENDVERIDQLIETMIRCVRFDANFDTEAYEREIRDRVEDMQAAIYSLWDEVKDLKTELRKANKH